MAMNGFVKRHRVEIWIFAIALTARLIFLGFFYPAFGENFIKGDAYEYINLAINIEDNRTFSNLAPPSTSPTTATAPLYPLLLVITRVKTSVITPLLFQNMLGALSAVFIYWLGRKLRFQKGAIIAALLFALEPGVLFYTNQIFTETLFTFFLLLSFLSLFNVWMFSYDPAKSLRFHGASRKILSTTLSGLFLGLAALTRPIALYLLPLFILYFFLQYLFKDQKMVITWSWQFVKKSLIVMIVFFIVISPWSIRNKKVFNTYVLSAGEAHILASYTLPAYWSWKDNISFKEAQIKSIEHFENLGISKDVIENFDIRIENRISKATFAILFSDPIGYVWSQMQFFPQFFLSSGWQAIANIFVGTEEKEAVFGEKPIVSTLRILGSGFWALIMLFAIAGFILAFKNMPEMRPTTILLTFIILMFAFATGALAYSRYRFPVNPILFLLAGYALYTLIIHSFPQHRDC